MMISLLLILLGAIILLAGFTAIAPQVRVHEIAVNSRAAWVFRVGVGLFLVGEMFGLFSPIDPALVRVTMIVGGATLFAGLTIVSHERQQAGYNFARSLSVQVFVAGALILILALLLWL